MTSPQISIENLRLQYQDHGSRANRLREAVVEQLSTLLEKGAITLGVPIESRVKDWNSIEDKLTRKSLALSKITDLDDLVGVRVILLFRRDLLPIEALLRQTFDVLSKEDTSSRLADAQFGYQSHHFVIAIPSSWAKIPTFSDLKGLRTEIQVRTLSQHIWAAASHKLQYKHEDSVPPPLKRTIYRVSALLETVDLEFERVLEERKNYVEKEIPAISQDEKLNVDLLAATLNDVLPPKNKDNDDEIYSELLPDLFHFSIDTAAKLRALLQKHLKTIKENDAEAAQEKLGELDDYPEHEAARIRQGIYYTHVGLAREALHCEFGEAVQEYMVDRSLGLVGKAYSKYNANSSKADVEEPARAAITTKPVRRRAKKSV
jgi:ppGpp synthetase/RelA/SpoT-type nucleotidyltranferase